MSAAESQIRVSVIMPVFDRADYVRESLDSVLATGYPALEIVAVDDGSTDGTSAILEDFRTRNGAALRVLRHRGGRNAGPWVSRNLAIAAATGNYVCFLDSDDVMLPHRFDRAMGILDGDPTLDGVLDVAEIRFDGEAERHRWGNRALRYGPSVASIPPGGFLAACLLDRVCSMHTSNLLVRKRLFERSGAFRPSRERSEDFHLWLRMAACGRFAVGDPVRPVTMYRRHSGNIWMPDPRDSVRDLGVMADVLRWARASPHVPPANVAVLRRAFRDKLRWCVRLLRTVDGRGPAFRLAAAALVRGHAGSIDPRLLAELGRLVFGRSRQRGSGGGTG